jgi:integrase
MLKIEFWHGLRVSEVISLLPEDCRDEHIYCERLKGSLKTLQPWIVSDDPELDYREELRELLRTATSGKPLFPITRDGVLKLIKRAGRKAGLPQGQRYKTKLRPHALKHSIAMMTIHDAGIENVRQWLGHKSIASTGAYLRVTDEAASRAIGKAAMTALGA